MASDAIIAIIEHGTGLDSTLGRRFVRDFSTAAETGAYKEFRTKYKLTHADWKKVPQSSMLIAAVKSERDRRAGNGSAVDTGGSSVSNVVDLHGRSIPIEDDELIENLARYADGTLSEASVKARHHLSKEDWGELGKSDRLVELVEAAKLRRICTGATKRERAQIEIVDGPPILGKIMRDPNSNARHVIDSVKTLDALASTGAEAAAAGARFEITINLGSDTERYSKSIEVNADDVDPHLVDATDVVAAITTNKSKGGGDGEGHI